MQTNRDAQIILSRIRRASGRQYPMLEKELHKLSLPALLELGRLLVDLEADKNTAVQNQRWWR